MGEHGLDAVLGEHGEAALGAEVQACATVGHPVQRLVDLGPAKGHSVVPQRDLVRALDGQPGCRRAISSEPWSSAGPGHRDDQVSRHVSIHVSISPIGSPTS